MADAGGREAVWEGDDDAGRRAAAGTCFCRLEAGGYRATTRLALVK